MSKKGQPATLLVNGKYFEATPFLINTKDEFGRPRLCTMMQKEGSIELSGGEEFLIAYVSRKMLQKRK